MALCSRNAHDKNVLVRRAQGGQHGRPSNGLFLSLPAIESYQRTLIAYKERP